MGIGLGLVVVYLSGQIHNMIAVVRNPSHASIEALTRLVICPSSTLVILEIDNTMHSDATTAIKVLQSDHDISHVNTVIANTRICHVGAYGPVAIVQIQDVKAHVDIDAIDMLIFFQAVLLSLQKSHRQESSRNLSRSYGLLRLWSSVRTRQLLIALRRRRQPI